ncbi:MAG: hypothetical protein FJ271_19400 [Planctomycetes bacterium]|nr:hypothetical protein [Planctomycetota bacterium]
MSDTSLTLTHAERDYLVQLLDHVLHDARIEEHRTRTPSYRQIVIEQENLLSGVLAKLRAAADKPHA